MRAEIKVNIKNGFKLIFNNKIVILSLIILITLLRIIYYFVFIRDGHHVDESWSYGFANSYYDPYLEFELGDDIYRFSDATKKNIGEWVSADVLKDYITVNYGERFRFGSVIYNKKGDASPPLYELILHFVCSFFPEKFSWWFAFSINIVLYFGIIILLFGISDNLPDEGRLFGRWNPYLICLFYGLSMSGMSTILCLRIYSLFTFLFILLMRWDQKYILKPENHFRFFLCTSIIVFLGSFTHFYFMVAAFFLTLFICLLLILRKRYKEMFIVGFSSLFGIVLFALLYPYGFMEIINETDSFVENGYRFSTIISLCLKYLFGYTFGINWNFTSITVLILLIILFWTALVLFAVLFLFRNDEWMIKLKKDAIANIKKLPLKIRLFINNSDTFMVAIFFTFICYVIVCAKYSGVIMMGNCTIRYFLPVVPIFVIFGFYVIHVIFSLVCIFVKVSKLRKYLYIAPALLLLLLLIRQELYFETPYSFRNDEKGSISDTVSGKNVIIIADSHFRLEWFSVPLMNADSFYFIEADNADGYEAEIYNLVNSPLPDDLILIIQSTIFPDEEELISDYELLSNRPFSYLIFETEDEYLNRLTLNTGKDLVLRKLFSKNISFGRADVFEISVN